MGHFILFFLLCVVWRHLTLIKWGNSQGKTIIEVEEEDFSSPLELRKTKKEYLSFMTTKW